jgi:hypothetical protein
MKTLRFTQFVRISMVSFMLLTVGLRSAPAYALPITGDPPEKAMECLGDLQGTLSSTPQPVNLWQTATLRWNVTVPSICTGTGVKLYVDNQVVLRTGSRTIQPIANTSYRLHAALPAVWGGGRRTLATTTAKVIMPPVVTINANYMAPLLVQALRDPFVPGTNSRYIYIENHVELNLSGREYIPIAAGVTLAGGRTAREAGPRLYTTTRPKVLFDIEGDNVRITGVRIEGPDYPGVVPEWDEPDKGIGILVYGDINIEIAHNEIYGWSHAAIRVNDCDGKDWCPSPSTGRMLPSENPNAVRIRDNYIHHNQHQGRNGYGVALHDGAYVLIERNVFDWNRHAIAGDGKPGTGYAAYRNLVLKNGGYHDTYNACDVPDWVARLSPAAAAAKVLCVLGIGPSHTHYTHQFDMHGTETCQPGHLNCGDAGHSMYIRHNTLLYTAGKAINLRGTPALSPFGMFIKANVFAHVSWDDAVAHSATEPCCELDNLYRVDASTELGSCDFDGDGLNDSFMATGATWWYSSGGDKPWVYLNTSLKRRSQVTLGFFNGDNICDVSVDGIIYPGGRTQTLPVNPLLPRGGVLR